MAIGSAGKKVNIVTPAHKVGSRSSNDEVKFTERPTTQQKSSIQTELEKEEGIVSEVVARVHQQMEANATREEEKGIKANKLFEQVLQVHRVETVEVSKAVYRERYIPQSKLIFNTDDEYNEWIRKGGMDKDLNPEFDYIVLRRIIAKEV